MLRFAHRTGSETMEKPATLERIRAFFLVALCIGIIALAYSLFPSTAIAQQPDIPPSGQQEQNPPTEQLAAKSAGTTTDLESTEKKEDTFSDSSSAPSTSPTSPSSNSNIAPDDPSPKKNGWFETEDGNRYYYGPNGEALIGWNCIEGEWYYLDPAKNGALVKGLFTVGKDTFITDGSGARHKGGWEKYQGVWYFARENGTVKTGWLTENGKKYWLDPASKGALAKGHFCVSGIWYITADGGAIHHNGWVEKKNSWYFANDDGSLKTGWLKRNDTWYRLDDTGIMLTGKYQVGSTWYLSSNSGAMCSNGWVKHSSKWYYAASDGALKTGWLKTGGEWYWLASDASMKKGWLKCGSTYYYLDKAGAMATGWSKIGGKWYWFSTKGAMETGWLKTGGKWYWLDSSGAMASSVSKTIGGKLYFFGSSGAMKSNCLVKLPENVCGYAASNGSISKIGIYKNGTPYLTNESGKAASGWVKAAGKWFYGEASTGKIKTGWLKTGGKWYWLDSSGVMKTGWLKTGGKWYWLDSSGEMQTGWHTINGKKYYFNSSGAWVNGNSMAIKAQSYSSGTKYLILVNRKTHTVGVFTGSKNNWNMKYNWSCVTGAPGTPTITGVFRTTGGKRMSLDTDSRARWCTQIWGGYFFHTILASTSELGHSLSHGCIRMAPSNAQWIYKNVRAGTTVVIY